MSPLFNKLNLGTHRLIHVLNAPASFEPELKALDGVTVRRSVTGEVGFALAFVITQAQLDSASVQLVIAAVGDALLWMVYPKGTSRRYTCEFNRDSGWRVLRDAEFESVRMVAIDEDWSALRFRRSEHVKPRRR
ncbi:MAG TPA: hypothetical protein VFG73_10365 [Rhodanobacteraceae bacterium]|nr:hypothetical protein [Rhodanobacteraceae bacterium]